jgi:hypothetical protein
VSPLGVSHAIRLDDLKSNTPYWAKVWAQDESGLLAQSQYVVFETLKRRLKITFGEAHIFDSGDFFGDGEPTWFFGAQWASGNPTHPAFVVDGCFPYTADRPDSGGFARALCLSGDTGEASNITDPDGGRVLPFYTPTRQALSYVFPEENFFGRLPEHIDLCGYAREDDSGFGIFDSLLHLISSFPISFDASGPHCSVHWNVPTSEHSAESGRLTVNASQDEGFRTDVIVTLEVFYDDLIYLGYPDGGLVVGSFPVTSNVHVARPPR